MGNGSTGPFSIGTGGPASVPGVPSGYALADGPVRREAAAALDKLAKSEQAKKRTVRKRSGRKPSTG